MSYHLFGDWFGPQEVELEKDIDLVLSKRHDNGADHWATPDRRIYVGNPFSTLSSLLILHELGLPDEHEAIRGGLELVRSAVRDDGRIRLAPRAPLYPCYTAEAARVLCRFGRHEEVAATIDYLLGDVHESGGWRCNFTKFGRGPETEVANPGATLFALDALRHYPELRKGNAEVDRAVESLLTHWETRLPTGPCHYGIGTLFMQIEFPFLRYNLFFYVYVLSFFARAKRDARFLEAWGALREKLSASGEIVVERPHRGLKGLDFCAKGRPSKLATRRYRELAGNLDS